MKRLLILGVLAVSFVAGVPDFVATAAPPVPGPRPGAPAISGTVTCREQVELPGTAVVRVELIEVSAIDSRTATVGEQTIWPAWVRLPVDFHVEYDPLHIDPRHTYILRARIMDGETLLFINTIPYYVLTQGASSTVNIVVAPARRRN